MVEIFTNISEEMKTQTKYWVDLALRQSNPLEGAKILSDFYSVQENENDRNFIDFYINMRFQQLNKELTYDTIKEKGVY